jgi:hypothetical protein
MFAGIAIALLIQSNAMSVFSELRFRLIEPVACWWLDYIRVIGPCHCVHSCRSHRTEVSRSAFVLDCARASATSSETELVRAACTSSPRTSSIRVYTGVKGRIELLRSPCFASRSTKPTIGEVARISGSELTLNSGATGKPLRIWFRIDPADVIHLIACTANFARSCGKLLGTASKNPPIGAEQRTPLMLGCGR